MFGHLTTTRRDEISTFRTCRFSIAGPAKVPMAMHQTVPVPGHVPGRVSGAAPHRAGDRLHGRSRPILYGLGAVLLLLLAWYLVSHLLAPKHKAPPPAPVKVAIAQRRDMTVTQKTI